MPFAAARDGTRLYFEEQGQGDCVLLIAGRNGDHRSWLDVPTDLGVRYRVVSFDYRGTGLSDAPEDPDGYSTRNFARDALAILDQLGIERAHVYGASMGGAVAQWLAIDQAARLGALVLGCSRPSAPPANPPAEWVLAAMRDPDVDARSRLLEGVSYSLEWIAVHPEEHAQFQAAIRPISPLMIQLHGQASMAHDVWEQLSTIQAPTLVLQGTDDALNPPANASLLAEKIPGAELRLIEGGRHAYFADYRQEANSVVLEFLTRHPLW